MLVAPVKPVGEWKMRSNRLGWVAAFASLFLASVPPAEACIGNLEPVRLEMEGRTVELPAHSTDMKAGAQLGGGFQVVGVEETEKRGEEDRAFNVSIKSGSGRMKIFRIAFPMAVRGGCNQPYLTE
jgi:hypothetical protein